MKYLNLPSTPIYIPRDHFLERDRAQRRLELLRRMRLDALERAEPFAGYEHRVVGVCIAIVAAAVLLVLSQ